MSSENRTTAPLWQWSAVELSGAIRDRRVSAADAVASTVERIRAENGHINAIVVDQTDAALEQAAAYDEILRKNGPIGPLHGVPVSIKINVDQEGTANSNGVTAFKDMIAPGDAPVVSNLKKAGAIIVGRSNTPEFSFRATTVNELHGRTYNPWDDNHSPGGSSGGASAAVAAGFCPIAHGNDIGGSLRFPAYQTGAVTVKPGQGRVPAYNPSGKEERSLLAQLMSVQGIIAREVRDVRLATRVLMQPDPRDPLQVPVPFDGPPVDQPIKVAFCRETNGYNIHPAIVSALEAAAAELEKAGYVVEEAAPPMIREAAAEALPALYADCEIFLGEAIKKYGSADIQKVFGYYFENYPPTDAVGLLKAMSRRTRYLRAWNLFLEEYPLVLTPFMMRPGFTWNEDADSSAGTRDIFDSSVYSWMINFLGLPASIAPAGYHEGLPLSVQLIARRFREDLALDAAEALERANGIQIHELWRRKGSADAAPFTRGREFVNGRIGACEGADVRSIIAPMSRRRITRHQLSIDDISALYETLSESQKQRYYRRWKVETPVLSSKRKRDVVQDDVRLKRLEDRAEGIEFALRFDDLTYRQRKEMEQMARNLRLAAQGMKKILDRT